MRVRIENRSFGYDLTIGIVISKGLPLLLEDRQIFKFGGPEESASHHVDESVVDLHLHRSDSKPGVDTVGIYVEHITIGIEKYSF